jgi:hypothetical protein
MFSSNEIYTAKKMKALIERTNTDFSAAEAPRRAIYYMRGVMGVFKYMQDSDVRRIFRDEKIRIGAVIDGIDKSLHQTPRVVSSPRGARTFTPWKKLGLGAKWDEYMNDVFKKAKDKGLKFIEDNLELLEDEYISQIALDKAKDDTSKSQAERQAIAEWAQLRSDIASSIATFKAEWYTVPDWVRPW